MKNATKHAEQLRSMFKRLVRDLKLDSTPKPKLDPLKALVRGAMSFDVTDAQVEAVMTLMEREFVDLNELRVATDLEIQELLGSRYPAIERRVGMITRSLNHIFEQEHTMSLERLNTLSRRDARQFLRELPDIHPFVEAYVMLFSFDGNAIPLDDAMLAYLREEGVVDSKIDLEEAQRFVEHHIKAEECYDFYRALRGAMSEESTEGKRKAKAKA